MNIGDLFRRVVNKLFPKRDIEKELKVNIAVSQKMVDALELWTKMFQNEPDWKGGPADVVCRNLPATITEEHARLILTEFSIKTTGSKRADYINQQLQNNLKRLDEHVEMYCAQGGIVLKPYVSGNRIKIDFTRADRFYPIEFDSNGEIQGAIFEEKKYIDGYMYTRWEIHKLVGTDYIIENRAYRSERLDVGQTFDDGIPIPRQPFKNRVALETIEEWQGLSDEPVTILNIERPLFVYVRVPRANNIDLSSPLGVSVYSKATDIIQEADKQYSRILWEFEATEAAVDVSDDVLGRNNDGSVKVPAGKERLFRVHRPKDGVKSYEVFSPQIRDSSLYNGLNNHLKSIEDLCGLSRGTLSDVEQIDKTATEIKASKHRSYTTISKEQNAWEQGFQHLIYIMDVYTTLYRLAPAGKVELSCGWGDSVLEDTDVEFKRRWEMVVAGKMKAEIFLAWYFECTIKEAMEMIPEDDTWKDFPESLINNQRAE